MANLLRAVEWSCLRHAKHCARGIDRIEAPSGGLFYPVYCGHGQDESDLIYMRARYYEPWTGRFISEDPAMDGTNWFVYCGNQPIGRVDPNGQLVWAVSDLVGILLLCFGGLVANAPEGAAVLGIPGIGGSVPVLWAVVIAGAILTIVGAIATIQVVGSKIAEIAASRRLANQEQGGVMVSALKSCRGTAMFGWMLEQALAINALNAED